MSTQDEKKCKSERLRFSQEEDLILLRDIIAYNPFEDPNRWQVVNHNLIRATGRPFTLRAIKDRIEYMLKLFSKEDTKNKKKSGTEEDYNEKDKLLQEVKDLQRDFKKQKGHTRDNGREKGQLLRQAATTSSCVATASEHHPHSANSSHAVQTFVVASNGSLMEDETINIDQGDEALDSCIEEEEQQAVEPLPETRCADNSRQQILRPSHTRKPRNSHQMKCSALLYLERRNAADQEHRKLQLKVDERRLQLEERKLALDERKLALEEARFELDKQERLDRVKMDRQLHEKILEFQEQLVSKLLDKGN